MNHHTLIPRRRWAGLCMGLLAFVLSFTGFNASAQMTGTQEDHASGNYSGGSSYYGNTMSRQDLENLFLHPMGISPDIRSLNKKEFEKTLRKAGIYFTSWDSGKDRYYDFPGKRVNINGVVCPINIIFDDSAKSVHINYWSWKLDGDEREEFRNNVHDNAQRIAQAFHAAGFPQGSWPGSDTVDSFKFAGHTIWVEVDGSNDMQLGIILDRTH